MLTFSTCPNPKPTRFRCFDLHGHYGVIFLASKAISIPLVDDFHTLHFCRKHCNALFCWVLCIHKESQRIVVVKNNHIAFFPAFHTIDSWVQWVALKSKPVYDANCFYLNDFMIFFCMFYYFLRTNMYCETSGLPYPLFISNRSTPSLISRTNQPFLKLPWAVLPTRSKPSWYRWSSSFPVCPQV